MSYLGQFHYSSIRRTLALVTIASLGALLLALLPVRPVSAGCNGYYCSENSYYSGYSRNPFYGWYGVDNSDATTNPFGNWYGVNNMDGSGNVFGSWYGVNNSDVTRNPFGDWYGVNNMDGYGNPFGGWYGVNNSEATRNPFGDWYGTQSYRTNSSYPEYTPSSSYESYAYNDQAYQRPYAARNITNAEPYRVAPLTGSDTWAPWLFAGLTTGAFFAYRHRKIIFT